MTENDYSQHYGTYKLKDGTRIEIMQSINEERYNKSKKRKEPKNIYLKNGVYTIVKFINYKRYVFGKYLSEEAALKARLYFETKGWEKCIPEKDKFSDIPEEVKGYFESNVLY